jgi:hypothetical protein
MDDRKTLSKRHGSPHILSTFPLPSTLAKALLAPRALPWVVSGRSVMFQSLGFGDHRGESIASTSLCIAGWSDVGQQGRGCIGGKIPRLAWCFTAYCSGSPDRAGRLTVVSETVLPAMGKCDTLDCAACLYRLHRSSGAFSHFQQCGIQWTAMSPNRV